MMSHEIPALHLLELLTKSLFRWLGSDVVSGRQAKTPTRTTNQISNTEYIRIAMLASSAKGVETAIRKYSGVDVATRRDVIEHRHGLTER
jgi:hypothetical protein